MTTIRIVALLITAALVSGCMMSGTIPVKIRGRILYVQPEHFDYYKEMVADLRSMSAELPKQGRTEIEIEDAQCAFIKRQLMNAPTPTHPRAESIKGVIRIDKRVMCLLPDDRLAKAERAGKQEAEYAAVRKVAAEREAEQKRVAKTQAKWDRERQRKMAKVCPKGLGDFGELVFANPYEVKDRCYVFVGSTSQILSRNIGLYGLGKKTAYIDFGSNAAPSTYFQGYVKGVGVFSYTTVLGAKMIVPSLVAADLPPEDFPASYAD